MDNTNVSYSTESCVTAIESQASKAFSNVYAQDAGKNEPELILDVPKKETEVEFKPGQKIELNIVLLKQELKSQNVVEEESCDKFEDAVEKIENTETAPKEAEEKESETKLKVPQRKISRFLVSPVLSGQLDLPKNKDYGETSVDGGSATPPCETKAEPEAPRRKDSVALEIKGATEAERGQEVTLEVGLKAEANEAPVCGPEMITLEQLKISLEHLKQGGPVSLKDSQKSVQSTSQTKTTATTTQASMQNIPQSVSQPHITSHQIPLQQPQVVPQHVSSIPASISQPPIIHPQLTQITSTQPQVTTFQQPQQLLPPQVSSTLPQMPNVSQPVYQHPQGYIPQQQTTSSSVLPQPLISPLPNYNNQITTNLPLQQQTTSPPQNIVSPPQNIVSPPTIDNQLLPQGNVAYSGSQVVLPANYTNNFNVNVEGIVVQQHQQLVEAPIPVQEEEKPKKIAPNLKLVIEK